MTGYSQFRLAASKAGPEIKKDLDNRLRELAEPTRATAEQFAATRIRRIGPVWSGMRVGVTRRVTYVAPKKRGGKTRSAASRPNLATLLEQRAMTPALEQHKPSLVAGAEKVLVDFALRWNRL
jgi:hypothetical protein